MVYCFSSSNQNVPYLRSVVTSPLLAILPLHPLASSRDQLALGLGVISCHRPAVLVVSSLDCRQTSCCDGGLSVQLFLMAPSSLS